MDELRLAISLSGLKTGSFNKVLHKVIIQTMLESDRSDFTLFDLQKNIKKDYGLDFSINELEDAINVESEVFTCISSNKTYHYSLNESVIERKNIKKASFDFDKCINLFINENKECIEDVCGSKVNEKSIKTIISDFLYYIFKTGKNELLALINKDLHSVDNLPKAIKLSDKKIIKIFLDWKNDNKDKFVFDVIRAAYDYCILTLKTDSSESIFSYKKIFLDTNVIFSLNGINGEEKQYSAKSFIEKCRNLHSEIMYTSETKSECQDTILSLVDNMSGILKKERFLDIDEMKQIFPSSNPSALYGLYTKWISGHPSRNGDYEGFKDHLLDILDGTFNELKFQEIPSKFINERLSEIDYDAASIESYKNNLGRKHSSGAALYDAKNFVYISSLKNPNYSTINEQKVFYVSFDTGFCSWAANQTKGSVNIFVLLSVMYAVMLRFSSRTKDDYRTFNDFISQRFASEYITEDEEEMKKQLIFAISELDVPDDAKKTMVIRANRELEKQTSKKKIEEISIEEIVEKAEDTFYKEYDECAKKEKEEAVNKASKQSYSEGYSRALDSRVEEVAKAERNWWIVGGIALSVIGGSLLIAAIVIFIKEKQMASVTAWILGGCGLFSGVTCIAPFVRAAFLKKPNKEKIRQKVEKKWEKQSKK